MTEINFDFAALRNHDAFRAGSRGDPRISVLFLIGELAGNSTAVGRYTNFYQMKKGNPGEIPRRHSVSTRNELE
jgi:hypothetical protein